MQMKRLMHTLLAHCVRLPGVKNIANLLYRTCCSKKALKVEENWVEAVVSTLPPRPKGRACWGEDRPIWGIDQYDLSVIIPFYKTEQYAEECIQSVLKQETTFRYEVILVDDGSPDGCPEILDRFRHFANVHVVHQENSGVSAARNHGVRLAQGQYVMFLDSDDLLCPGAIEALMSAAETDMADIVEGAFATMTQGGRIKSHYPHVDCLGTKGKGMYGYPWGKVLRKDLFQEVCFPEGYWFEDTIVSAMLFPQASITRTITDNVVMYRANPTGLTMVAVQQPKSIDTYYIIEEILTSCEEVGVPINKASMLRQLGPYLYGRIYTLPEENIQALFCKAAELVEKYDLATDLQGGSYYEQQLCEAFKFRRYKQWKWVSILM